MNIFASLFRTRERRRTYSDMMQLDEHLLRDIGVTRSDLFSLVNDQRARRKTRDHE